MFEPTIFDMSVTSISSCRHLDVSVISCTLLLPLLAGIRTALYVRRLSQLLVGSTYCSLSGVGAVLPAVWFISEVVQSLLRSSVPKRLRGALPGIHRFMSKPHFPAQQWPLCKALFLLSPLQITRQSCAHEHARARSSAGSCCVGACPSAAPRGGVGPPNPCAFSRDRNGDREQL